MKSIEGNTTIEGVEIPHNLTVTINTDASFSPGRMTGGFAYWISGDGWKIQNSGKLRRCKDSTQAEMQSLCNGFYSLEKTRKSNKIRVVYVNCDNQAVRNFIKKKKIINGLEIECEILDQYMKSYEFVIAKTIRGHQNIDTPRHFVNNWCDRESRKYIQN